MTSTPSKDRAEAKTCTMGVGCDEVGVCYAAAHGEPERCGRETARLHARERASDIFEISVFLAAAHEEGRKSGFAEGMKRAAEIARRQAKFHLDASAMSLPVEPSPIIAKDRAKIATIIAEAIISEAEAS